MWESRGSMLTADDLVRRRSKTDFVLLQRGPKCFTPSGSWLESRQLQTLLVATKDLIAEERVERESALAQAEWDENLKVAIVSRVVGRQFEKFGHEENMTIFLYPEEALYLLETNHLQLLYGGVSMSIQQAYSVLIGPKTGCTFVEYMVFSHLLKNGFKVLRHSAKRTITRYERQIGLHQELPKNKKIKRKCSAQGQDRNDQRNTSDPKSEINNEKFSMGGDSVNLHMKIIDSKSDKCSAEKYSSVVKDSILEGLPRNCSNVTHASNFSSSSDIEILSEKNVSRSEENLEYDITEHSSSGSEDSDCQMIFSGSTEKDQGLNQKVIEEVNLSDSDVEIESSYIKNPSQMKSESIVEEIICDGARSNEGKILNNDYNNLNLSSNIERHFNQGEGFKLESNDDDNITDLNYSNKVADNQKLLMVQPVDENTIPFNSNIEQEIPNQENSEEMSECVPIIIDVKEEESKWKTTSLSLPGVSIIQKNTNIPLNMEGNTLKVTLKDSPKQEEIEVIDLDDDDDDDDNNSDNVVTEDRDTILLSFPNCAGCHTICCDVPPQRLCPPNVQPIFQSYSIVLDHLQDPQFGGNPNKKKNVGEERFRNNYGRYQNSGYTNNNNNRPRFHSHSNRPYNRRFLNSPRENESLNRYGQERHDGPDMHRDESFQVQMFRGQSPMDSCFQSMNMNQDQNTYPHFSGVPPCNSTSYPCSRSKFSHRGNYSPRPYRLNTRHRFPFSRSRRFPRRKSRGGRSVYPVSRRNELNFTDDMNVRNEGYVPVNTDNSDNHLPYNLRRRFENDNFVHKRHGWSHEGNRNLMVSGRKRPRGMRNANSHFSSTTRSHDLMDFLDTIQTDTRGNSETNFGSNHHYNQEGIGLNRGNTSALSNSESSESSASESSHMRSSSSSSRSSSSSSANNGSSPESSDESMGELSDNVRENIISVLFKSDELEDIDISLKNLEIVQSVIFKELTAFSDETLLVIKFDLYQPYTHFRRSDPPVPDFRVVVMQPDQNLPTSRQLAFLGKGFDDAVPLLFAIASADSVAFYLQSVVDLPHVNSKEHVQG